MRGRENEQSRVAEAVAAVAPRLEGGDLGDQQRSPGLGERQISAGRDVPLFGGDACGLWKNNCPLKSCAANPSAGR